MDVARGRDRRVVRGLRLRLDTPKRDAYRFSVETSVYVDPRFHRRGIARDLYQALLADLARRGYCNAYAGVALPNDASVALHRHLGFEPIGVFRAVGYN